MSGRGTSRAERARKGHHLTAFPAPGASIPSRLAIGLRSAFAAPSQRLLAMIVSGLRAEVRGLWPVACGLWPVA
jgi:hypothetical protein